MKSDDLDLYSVFNIESLVSMIQRIRPDCCEKHIQLDEIKIKYVDVFNIYNILIKCECLRVP